MSIRVNVSHLCRRRLSWKFNGMYPIVFAALNDIFGLLPNRIALPGCFIIFMMMFVMFVITTINQIKDHLHIRAFHVQAKMECFVCFIILSFSCHKKRCRL